MFLLLLLNSIVLYLCMLVFTSFAMKPLEPKVYSEITLLLISVNAMPL